MIKLPKVTDERPTPQAQFYAAKRGGKQTGQRIQLTPEKRAAMLRMAERKYRDDGHRGHDAKRLARLALTRFIEQHNGS
ncbi:hypothetical protein [Kosakonia phage Kc166B]|nr:hypothetical protein [Kosakonia phage Kc237]QQV88691.1 hypothetical protein [Kosakonia phage Kc166B]